MVPRRAGQTPTMAFNKEDLPEAVGPTTPSAAPAFSENAMLRATMRVSPGGDTARPSLTISLRGAGSCRGDGGSLVVAMSSDKRCQAWRAATKIFQFEIARSIGASARAVRIDPAMMIPPLD